MTPRQKQVLTCVQQGLSNKLIARQLKISEATVKAYVSVLLAIYEVRTRQQLLLITMTKKEWVGLTDDEIEEIFKTCTMFNTPVYFASQIEAKLKEKNEAT